MNGGTCPHDGSTALVVSSQDTSEWTCDPVLAGELTRLAAASGGAPPLILPGAAVHLLNVDLPLKTARQRRAALPFAVEPQVAARLEDTQLALGPEVGDGRFMAAAASRVFLDDAIDANPLSGPALPDYLAVPTPDDPNVWSLWCGENQVYLRFSDGSALALVPEVFPTFWRNRGRPALHLWHGTPPLGVMIERRCTDLPELDPAILSMDLRPATHRQARQEWLALGRFTMAVAGLSIFAYAALVHLDAIALRNVTQERGAAVQAHLAAKGLDPSLFNVSAETLSESLFRSIQPTQVQDEFLALLSRTASQLSQQPALAFRDIRFDQEISALRVLMTADTLDALDAAEASLRGGGLTVTTGAATRTGSGAEMEVIVAGAG